MLMLRFLTKICSSDPESLVVRAVRMSMDNITDMDCSLLETKHQQKDVVHKQSWAQQVLAAASRLRIPLDEVRSMRPGILLTIREEQTVVNGVNLWECVQSPTTYVLGCNVNVRIAMREEPLGGVYVEGEHAWAVCRSDMLTNQPLFQQWSEPLRLGYYAAIRKQGNRSRQAKNHLSLRLVKSQGNFKSRSELWAVMMLCTTAASFPPDPPNFPVKPSRWEPVSEEATEMAKEINTCLA